MAEADSVIIELEKILREHPDNHEKRIELATHCMSRGDYYSAAAELQRVVRQTPPTELYKEAYYQLGMVLRTMGNFPEALKCMEKFIAVDRNNGNALYYAGLLHAEMGDYQKASDALKKSITIIPQQSYLHYALGNVMIQTGAIDEAIGEFRKAIQCNAKDTQAKTAMGLAHLLKGASKEAAKELKELFTINPKDSTATFLYAWALMKEEDEVEALERLEKFVRHDPSNPLGFLSLSALHFMIEEYEEGEKANEKAISLLKPSKDPISAAALNVIAASLSSIARDKEMLEEDADKARKNVVKAFQEIMELRDPLLREKSEKIGKLAKEMAKKSEKFEDEEIEDIKIAASLCNLGTAFIPDAVLYKEEKLTDDEKRILASHPLMTVKILQRLDNFEEVSKLIRHHHERFNGTGYPDRLKGEAIPRGSAIIGVADFFTELTLGNKRQKAATREEVLRTLVTLKDNFFSKEVVDMLTKVVPSA
jgi:HD-GYP domain-containing protein (c-di-GMP phosphodiesterase class II)